MLPLVLCCGLIRSGSTVLYQIASGIVELRKMGKRRGYYEAILTNEPPELPADEWSVLKLQVLGDREHLAIQQGAIVLYSFRDVNESLASLFRAFKIAEGNRWYWRAVANGYAREMQTLQAPNVHRIPFEDIRDSLAGVIIRVASWIPGRELELAEVLSLAEDLSLERQKARPKITPYDPETLLFPQHFD